MLECHNAAVSQYWSVKILGCHIAGMSQCWSVTMLECHNAGVSQYWSVTILECHNAGVSQCWSFTILECHNTGVSQYWSVTMHAVPYVATRRTLFEAEQQNVVVKWRYNLVYRMSKFQMSVPTLVILRCFRGFPHSLQTKARHISSHTHLSSYNIGLWVG
jgi:hypothetical protein